MKVPYDDVIALLAFFYTAHVAFFYTAHASVTIPDSVSLEAKRLVYYTKKGTWYEADRVCRAADSNLVLVDGPGIAGKLQKLTTAIGETSLNAIYTRMVRHDNGEPYSHDDTCSRVNMTSWSWKTSSDATWDRDKQCVLADGETFAWQSHSCDTDDEFVCEYPQGSCGFQMSSVSLASFPVLNANMAVCQTKCRQMIGCFATAPSGHVTLPPFTHCLFVVTGDDSNRMATLNNCTDKYEHDSTTDAHNFDPPPGENDPGKTPHACTPSPTTSSISAQDQQSLAEFLQESSTTMDCAQTVIYPTPVIETAYVTVTPDVMTSYVSLLPEILTAYVTATPEIRTAYITVTAQAPKAYITLTPSAVTEMLTTTVQLAMPTTVEQFVTVTETASVSCSPQISPSPGYIISTVTTTETHSVKPTLCPTVQPLPCSNTITIPPAFKAKNTTEDQIQKEMDAVVKELTVDHHNVSRSRRKKESAPDERTSAKTVGLTATLLMVVGPLVVMIFDIPAFYRDMKRLRSNNDRTS